MLAEGLAIVVSILFAFAIDAWWQSHIEDEREHELLVALLDDFEHSKSNIREWRDFHLAVQQSNLNLLKAATSADITLSEEAIDRLIADLGWWDIQRHFTTGALNSVVFGGELSIIENDRLRQELADWPSQIENLASQQNQDYDFFLNVWMPYLRANGYLPQISNIAAPMPGRPEIQWGSLDLALKTTKSHAAMITTDEFQNLLVQKSWIQFDILNGLDEIESRLDHTIQLIQEML